MNPQKPAKLVLLAILDGWGITPPGPGNAVSLANTVNINKFWASYPHTQLKASEESVGLPHGEAGNTETGHLNLGAGRIVYQDLARINTAIAEGSFFTNEVLIGAMEHAKKNNSCLHFMGLLGAGGVHSNVEHLYALIRLAKQQNAKDVALHIFTDGRDSPPTAAATYIAQLREVIKKEGIAQIASIMGRYWAMDRDLRWERTAKAYFALTKGEGHLVKTPEEAIQISYSQGKTDEFIEPANITDNQGKPICLIKDNDAVVFYNSRIDRPRQLSKAFVIEEFKKGKMEWDFDPYAVKYEKKHIPGDRRPSTQLFERGEGLKNLYFVMMTEYGKPLVNAGAKVAFPPETVDFPIGRVISEANLRQLRVAESEKERFVTFYFNGQKEKAFPREERLIVHSPKVATYDLMPEMSAREMTDKLLAKLRNAENYSFVLLNYANPDMVGHTGSIGPAVRACEVVDESIGRLANFVTAYGGILLITADHGNVEEMINSHTGQIDTEHSINPVPFIAVSRELTGKPQTLPEGILADVAPTVLSLLSLEKPTSMTGRNLLGELWKR